MAIETVSITLTWGGIREIVKAADAVLGRYSKKELVEMGESGYYTEVLKEVRSMVGSTNTETL